VDDLLTEVRESLSLPRPKVRREIREAAGVPQSRLAEELGVHVLTVHRWEAGTREPRGLLRLDYARLLRRLDEAVREIQEQSA
jgi:DNA-binding transcriptional regulator YiaG